MQIANAHQKAQDAAGVWDNYELAKQAGHAVGPQNLSDESRKVYFDIVKLLAEDARSRDETDAAIENYQRVLKQNLPPNVLPVVKHQFTEIKRSHDRIRDLEEAA